jgi:AAA15 family ATPase/GTPase
MVLEIRLNNFYSIKDEIILDLRAGNIQTKQAKELDTNVFEWSDEKILKTVAIYGANASGKSNVVKAIRFCCKMIFESHLYNENTIFDFEPFKFDKSQKESTFFIRFVSNDIEYEYSFSLTKTEITKETLYYYPNNRRAKVFERDESLSSQKRDKYSFTKVIKRPLDVAQNTSNKTLYISRASQMDRELGKEIFNYFSNKFVLGYMGFNPKTIISQLANNKEFLLRVMQIADSDIVGLDYKKESSSLDKSGGDSIKIISYHKSSPDIPFDFDKEESDGTRKLFFAMLNILDIIKNDKILLVDEIETSLHTSIIEFIIQLFNMSNKSQLIYTTHNTNLLDLKKTRKDQIYFVNKSQSGDTELYSLFDFKDFRENMDAEKGYLQGRFDAIPFIDLSQSFINEIKNG